MQRNKPQCEKWLKTVFADWIKSLPCKKVVFTAGNHDFVFENRDFLWNNSVIKFPTEGKAEFLDNSHLDYLSDEGKVYRTPACHEFVNWANKSTNIMKVVIDTYKEKDIDYIKNTKIWVCDICGFVYIGDNPPKVCPVCKVPSLKILEVC